MVLSFFFSPSEIEKLRKEIGKKAEITDKKSVETKDNDSGNESAESAGSPEKEAAGGTDIKEKALNLERQPDEIAVD